MIGLPDRWGSLIFHLEYCVSLALTPWDAWRWRAVDLNSGLGLHGCALNVDWAEKCADAPLANGNEIGSKHERQLSSGAFPPPSANTSTHTCAHKCYQEALSFWYLIPKLSHSTEPLLAEGRPFGRFFTPFPLNHGFHLGAFWPEVNY